MASLDQIAELVLKWIEKHVEKDRGN